MACTLLFGLPFILLNFVIKSLAVSLNPSSILLVPVNNFLKFSFASIALPMVSVAAPATSASSFSAVLITFSASCPGAFPKATASTSPVNFFRAILNLSICVAESPTAVPNCFVSFCTPVMISPVSSNTSACVFAMSLICAYLATVSPSFETAKSCSAATAILINCSAFSFSPRAIACLAFIANSAASWFMAA